MTIEQKIKTMLVEYGLMPAQAEAVFAAMKTDPVNEVMQGRWEDELIDYPPEFISAAWMSACTHAVEWIDKNLPRAFYRSLFANAVGESEESKVKWVGTDMGIGS